MAKEQKRWKDFEQIARKVLEDAADALGVSDWEVGRSMEGAGTRWEIDVSGYRDSDGALVIAECKDYKARVPQETLGGFAYRIERLGAGEGFIVTKRGLQKGAQDVADYEGIQQVVIREGSTLDDYVAEVAGMIRVAVTARGPQFSVSASESIPVTEHTFTMNGPTTRVEVVRVDQGSAPPEAKS